MPDGIRPCSQGASQSVKESGSHSSDSCQLLWRHTHSYHSTYTRIYIHINMYIYITIHHKCQRLKLRIKPYKWVYFKAHYIYSIVYVLFAGHKRENCRTCVKYVYEYGHRLPRLFASFTFSYLFYFYKLICINYGIWGITRKPGQALAIYQGYFASNSFK